MNSQSSYTTRNDPLQRLKNIKRNVKQKKIDSTLNRSKQTVVGGLKLSGFLSPTRSPSIPSSSGRSHYDTSAFEHEKSPTDRATSKSPSLNPEVLKLNEWKEQFHNSLQYIQEEIIIHLLQKDASVDEIGVLIRKTISELKMSVSELLNMMASLIRKYVQKSRLDLENSNSYWHGVVIDLNNQIEHLTRIAAIEEERRKNSESEIKRLKKYISMLRSERSTMKKEMKDAQIPIIQTGESNNDAKNSLSAKEVQEKNNIERLRGKPVNVKQSPRPEARDQSSKKNIEKKGGVSKGMERSSPEHISPTINPEKVQEQKDQAARTENEDKRKPDIILEDKKDIPVQISENERVVEEETTTADEKQGFEKSSGESEQQALSQEQTVSQQKGNNSEPEQILSRKELLRLKMQNKRAGRVRGVESVISNAETDSSASSNFITDRGVDEEANQLSESSAPVTPSTSGKEDIPDDISELSVREQVRERLKRRQRQRMKI